MLYNGHLVIKDTFLRNRPSNRQALIENVYIAENFIAKIIADTFFEHRVNILGKIYLLLADTL